MREFERRCWASRPSVRAVANWLRGKDYEVIDFSDEMTVAKTKEEYRDHQDMDILFIWPGTKPHWTHRWFTDYQRDPPEAQDTYFCPLEYVTFHPIELEKPNE